VQLPPLARYQELTNSHNARSIITCIVRHQPNADSVEWAARLWPRLSAALPAGTQLHVYGAYPQKHHMAASRPDQGTVAAQLLGLDRTSGG
jgi:hypothetical protein